MRLRWSQEARKDRLSIIRYIGRHDPAAATRMSTLLKNAARNLLKFPLKGRCGRVEGTRELVAHQNYLLIYIVDGDIRRKSLRLWCAALDIPVKNCLFLKYCRTI